MRLVVDTNILLSALLTRSVTRRLIIFGKHELYYPKEALTELEMCKRVMAERGRIEEREFDFIKDRLFGQIELISVKNFPEAKKAAEQIMRGIDENDAVFVAVALLVPDCGVWSNDRHLKAQNKIRVVTTEDLLG